MTHKSCEKNFWIVVGVAYAFPTLFFFWFSGNYGVLLVDLIPLKSELGWLQLLYCLLGIAISYLFIYLLAMKWSSRFSEKKIGYRLKSIGVIIFILQLVSLFLVLFLDYGRVGGAKTTNNYVGVLFSYLHVEVIFIFYYSHVRVEYYPRFNTFIFLITAVIKGWTSPWLIIILLESYFSLRRIGVIAYIKRFLPFFFVIMIAYPWIFKFKLEARGESNIADISFVGSYAQLVNRLQLLTSTALVYENENTISNDLNRGAILPFYHDNTIGKWFLGNKIEDAGLQKYLSLNYLIDFSAIGKDVDSDNIGWYVQTGLISWLFLIEWYVIPIYLLFVALLIVLPYFIASRYLKSRSAIPVIHIGNILYVFHGWFAVQFGFIIGLVWYVLLCRSLTNMSLRKNLRAKSKCDTFTGEFVARPNP